VVTITTGNALSGLGALALGDGGTIDVVESGISLANLGSRSHSDLADAPTGAHHSGAAHEPGGALEVNDIDINNSGTLVSGHSARHSQGGADELQVEDLATAQSIVDNVVKTDGSGGLVTGHVEHGAFEINHTSWPPGLSDEEIGRVQLQPGETMIPQRLEFRQKGGGSSTLAQVEIIDYAGGLEGSLGSQDLGGTNKDLTISGPGNLVKFWLTNQTGGTIDASVLIHYVIQGT